MDFNNLTEEQKAKVRDAKTAEDRVVLVKAEGMELTDDQLEAISGGSEWYEPDPAKPGS